MAKKSAKKSSEKNQQKIAAENRWGDFTPEDLDILLTEFEKAHGTLKGVVSAMKRDKTPSIRVDGATKFKRAVEQLKAFALNAKHAHDKEQLK